MNDCEVLRNTRPDLEIRKCCWLCHERKDFTSTRLNGTNMRLCCSVFSSVFRCSQKGDLSGFDFDPPPDLPPIMLGRPA